MESNVRHGLHRFRLIGLAFLAFVATVAGVGAQADPPNPQLPSWVAQVQRDGDPALIPATPEWATLPPELRERILGSIATRMKAEPALLQEDLPGPDWPRLFLAAYRGQTDIVRLLLDLGAKTQALIDANRGEGGSLKMPTSVLHAALAMMRPMTDEPPGCSPETVRLLLSRGEDANETLDRSLVRFTVPLHAAVFAGEEFVQILLDHGADVHALDPEGNSVMHLVEKTGIAVRLAVAGARLDVRNSEGHTPLEWAALHTGRMEIAEWLVAQGWPMTAEIAAVMGRTEFVMQAVATDPELLHEPGAYRRTLLHHAAARGHADLGRRLLRAGAKVDVVDLMRRTPQEYALMMNCEDLVRALLDQGADVNQVSSSGEPLFHQAIFASDSLTRLLLERGADPGRTGDTGETPLHPAVRSGRAETVTFLIERGVPIDAPSKNGDTPLLTALRRSYHPRNPAVVRVLLEAGADPNVQAHDGLTPMHLASDLPAVQLLLRRHGAR